MPKRKKFTFKEFNALLIKQHGFRLERTSKHSILKKGSRTVPTNINKDSSKIILPNTLSQMIIQSGMPKSVFLTDDSPKSKRKKGK